MNFEIFVIIALQIISLAFAAGAYYIVIDNMKKEISDLKTHGRIRELQINNVVGNLKRLMEKSNVQWIDFNNPYK